MLQNQTSSQNLNKYRVTYYRGAAGYAVSIDANASITEVICSTTSRANSRREALENGIKTFVRDGHMNRATGDSYISHLKTGAKTVRLSCAK